MSGQNANRTFDVNHSHDAYSPREIARKIQGIGVVKARKTSFLTIMVLSVLAGAFISLGAMLYLVVVTEPVAGFGATRLIGGLSFCLGLVLVVVAGAELFTGNNLIAMAWASGDIGTGDLFRNWVNVYLGNVVGCLGTVILIVWADTGLLGDGMVGETAIATARAKAELSALTAFARGVLCNALVCLAVWLAMGGRSVTDKILAVLFPVTAFVALGFEHSIANWFFLPYGFWLDPDGMEYLPGMGRNLIAVTAGNVVGGSLLVAAVYWLAYLRDGVSPES